MLAVSSSLANERETQFLMEDEEEFTSDNLVDSIDFDDILVGFEVLPDLDMYQDHFLPDFSVSVFVAGDENSSAGNSESNNHPYPDSVSVSGSGSDVGFGSSRGEEIMSKRDDESAAAAAGKSKKSSSHSKKPPGKKKTKVDWTPELHRRFVEAVEQLGLDKAVPSRIREIMGVDTLTRHNIASHLQKYRSHRKHSEQWGRQAAAKREVKPAWIAPTMGFPPPPVTPIMPQFTPLHVWGHPSVHQSMMAMWPKYVAPPPPTHSQPPWSPAGPTFWHSHHQYVPTTGTPCYPPPTRFPSRPAVVGVPPVGMYKVEPGIGVAAPQTLTKALPDFHPSKESIDAAIGDVIGKPWLPLPLGLKPPSIDSVMSELQRQGVSEIISDTSNVSS